MSLFNYILKPAAECRFPISENGHKNIAWFWLTDCNYYLQLGDVKLFESSNEWLEKYPADCPYDEYPYIRQLEDLFDILPQIAAGISETAYRFIETKDRWEKLMRDIKQWYEMLNDHVTEEQDVLYDDLMRFIYHSYLDTGYLRFKSQLFFHHVDDRMIVRYDFSDNDENNIPVWSAKHGTFEMTWIEFLNEIEDLLDRFFADMNKQVEDAIRIQMNDDNWVLNRPDHLRQEHLKRKHYFYTILDNVKKGHYHPDIECDKVVKQIAFVRRHLFI